MSGYTIARGAASWAAAFGAAKIAKEIVMHNVHAPQGKFDKVTMGLGLYVIGGMAGEAVKTYTEKWIDEMRDDILKSKAKLEELQGKIDITVPDSVGNLADRLLDPDDHGIKDVGDNWNQGDV